MKYYQMHERVYKDLQEHGFVSWDKEKNLDDLYSHQINFYLKKLLDHQSISLKNLKTLDLGTGTGTSALYCAKEGADSLGIDLSKTAIEMAHVNNDNLHLNAKFMEADILTLSLDQKFDLITDSSLLHCLVGIEDRGRFYDVLKGHLAPAGLVFIHTMTESQDMSLLLNSDYLHFDQGILYSLGIKEIESGRKDFDGKSYFPHRSILKKEDLIQEISSAGFEIVCSSVVTHDGDPDNFVALIKLASVFEK